MDGFEIHRAGTEYAEAIARVHNAAFAPFFDSVPPVYRSLPVDAADVRTWLEEKGDVILAAVAAEGVVGYCHVRPSATDEIGFVSTDEHAGQSRIAVHPAFQRRGIGRALVSQAIYDRGSQPFWIWVGAWSDNAEASAFLDALGFACGTLDDPCPHTVDPSHTDDSVLATFDLSGPLPDVPAVPGLVIRGPAESDVEPMRAVFGESRPRVFGTEPTADDVRRWMTGGGAAAIAVAEYDGRVVGSMEFRTWGVLGIAGVLPKFRRHGIGGALFAATLGEMKRRGLEHALADTGWFDADALRLLARLGFDTSRWLRSWMKRFRLRPRRTGTTDLTDDELILLDFLWLHGARVADMEAGRHGIAFGFGLDHEIPDEELATRLSWLEEQGLVEIEESRFGTGSASVRITDAGLDLWEAERAPPWDRFVQIRGPLSLADRRFRLVVISPDRGTAERVFRDHVESWRVRQLLEEPAIRDWQTISLSNGRELRGCTEISADAEQAPLPHRFGPSLLRGVRDWWRHPADLAYPPFA